MIIPTALLFITPSVSLWCASEELSTVLGQLSLGAIRQTESPALLPASTLPLPTPGSAHPEGEMVLKLESRSWMSFTCLSLGWGCLAHLWRESLPCRVGPLLTTENSEAQRWARVGPATVGSPVQSVAGPLPLCNPEFGLYAAPKGEMGGPKDVPAGLRRRWTGCLEAEPRACLLFSLLHANHRPCQHVPMWGASDMCLHPVRRQKGCCSPDLWITK